jgi:hypothetical protein
MHSVTIRAVAEFCFRDDPELKGITAVHQGQAELLRTDFYGLFGDVVSTSGVALHC